MKIRLYPRCAPVSPSLFFDVLGVRGGPRLGVLLPPIPRAIFPRAHAARPFTATIT